jgi:hypothetical protein
MTFPALVTNTVGIRNFPSESISLLNDSNAEGNTFFPRTITPSISNNNPNAGFPSWKETCSYLEGHYNKSSSIYPHIDDNDAIPTTREFLYHCDQQRLFFKNYHF